MSEQQLTLSQYLSLVKEVVHLTFQEGIWVKAEIRNLNIKSGHYYLELAEKDLQTDQVIANCRATIWKSKRDMILKFQRETQIELAKDLNVLILVKARFEPQYGFSLNIEEIDSAFSLGDLAQRYQQIVAQLKQDHLLDRNKQLAMPFNIENVLVIAPENAAGLGDFKKDAQKLEQLGLCRFVYQSATFQGQHAAQSIMQNLAAALKQWAEDFHQAPDLIVIIRGGGAVNDLAYLNDYALATLLCKRTVPIWVGIGHEKDRTILDEIAHRSFDTPSKVIVAIRDYIIERCQYCAYFMQQVKTLSQQRLAFYQQQSLQYIKLTQSIAQQQLKQQRQHILSLKNNSYYFAKQHVKTARREIDGLLRESLLQNPKDVLRKGYAIVRYQQRPLARVQPILQLDLKHAQDITVELYDGEIQAKIQKVMPI
ncbi:exodeoxyribonuclease VII large subunit [Acinetobacter larvae]|uniref:Exodeoxyribonuclease 7 large subunit n=1 Tax=Acinetobacter larvae TaxID=1789224 RepID=A0A1B2LXA4_9GAMM|nr:exodeoxyribonuclease VII large subunit [Acinetobacter larvae]AOA57592.1 exodeoxyribonuclease VII large subunit [Acinetobacter larvae]